MPALTDLAYSEFTTTQANLLTDLRTAILASASWTRPNAGSKPSTYKATTTRGADMVFDLEDAAIDTQKMTIGVWRSYDGTTFTDKTQRYLYWRNTAGASTNVLHCIVSISKEHVFISVEGPRGAESGTESTTNGSGRQSFFMCDLVPYFGADTNPVVFAGGNPIAQLPSSNININCVGHVTRDYANTTSWSQGYLATLTNVASGGAVSWNYTNKSIIDSNYYIYPYVYISTNDGIRGRLATFFFAGYVLPDNYLSDVYAPSIGARITYDSQVYKIVYTNKAATNSGATYNQFGYHNSNNGNPNYLAIAIPAV